METTPQHLQAINASLLLDHGENHLFKPFPRLPPELRRRIWLCSLERHRLLDVEIESPADPGDHPYSTRDELKKVISGRNYNASVRGIRLNSKLLRVNSESRHVALSFYRVHIPCSFRIREGTLGPSFKSVLYFNPEWDFMRIQAHRPVEHAFVDFVVDLKAHDPRNIGLQNLALDTNGLSSLQTLQAVDTDAPAKAAFIDCVARLREIIWVAESHAGRAILAHRHDFQGVGVRFNHSMPVRSVRPSFDLLERDPRQIGADLEYILTGASDPREMRVLWRELLARWGVCQDKPVKTKERVLFAFKPLSSEEQIHTIKTATVFLKEEHERWLRDQQRWHTVVMRYAGKIPIESPEELEDAVKPAIGFWLFPAEALGDLEGDVSGMGRVFEKLLMKNVFDMRGYWPELAVSHIY